MNTGSWRCGDGDSLELHHTLFDERICRLIHRSAGQTNHGRRRRAGTRGKSRVWLKTRITGSVTEKTQLPLGLESSYIRIE